MSRVEMNIRRVGEEAQTYRVCARSSDTVATVMRRVEEKHSIPRSRQRLYDHATGAELLSWSTLAGCHLSGSCDIVDSANLRREDLVGYRVRSWWAEESRWYTAKISEAKGWVAGVYPVEGICEAGWFYELKYIDTDEFEYIREEALWSTVQPAGILPERPAKRTKAASVEELLESVGASLWEDVERNAELTDTDLLTYSRGVQ